VEERDVLAAENAALQAELAPLSAQADALMAARSTYTDAPAAYIAVVAEVRTHGFVFALVRPYLMSCGLVGLN